MQAVAVGEPRAIAARVPWYIWSAVAAITCGVMGGVWDISWHESVGRDTFWTAPHILIYLGGILAGVTSGYLILAITYGRETYLADASVCIWGFRGPLGAFLCAWGAIAMITSAPFDNWWHNAYGLDVKILSPPHILLALGLVGIRFGTLVLILPALNRAYGESRVRLQALTYYALVFMFGLTVGIMQEMTFRNYMHGARFYLVMALTAPVWLGVTSRVLPQRWACTVVTAIYTFWHLLFIWILPLVPAEPKLGPVYFQVTHLVPPDFPLLLIVPGIACDLVRQRITGWRPWTQALALGSTFLAAFLAAQWPFATFLMSPASRNWFFGTNYFPFFLPPTSDWARNVFTQVEQTTAQFWWRMALALAAAVATTRTGIAWGEWMHRLRR